jgi:phosphoglycerate kinase
MTALPHLDFAALKGKKVLLRLDLNVPIKNGEILDQTRIERSLTTLENLLKAKAKVIILAHFGRPKGQKNPAMSLKPVADALQALLEKEVHFADDCLGESAESVIREMKEGDVTLLENLRFYKEEEANDPDFAKKIASLADCYVNDAFSVSHRAHASVEAITHFLPSYAGKLLQTEIEALSKAFNSPERPLIAIVAGSKVSTKLALLKNLVLKVNTLVVGGGIANTFLYAQGCAVGQSLVEKEMTETVKEIQKASLQTGCQIIVPHDAIIAAEIKEGTKARKVPCEAIPDDQMILDIGPDTINLIEKTLEASKTLVWNGPLGVFEVPPFDQGSLAIAKKVAALTKEGKLFSVAGGGETGAVLAKVGISEQLSYLSTAGGAFLEWLEGKNLPGIEALANCPFHTQQNLRKAF